MRKQVLNPLNDDRWYRKLYYLYIIVVHKSPNHVLKVVPSSNTICNTRNTNDIHLMNIKHNFFKNTFFPSTIIELAKLDSAIRNSTSCNSFKESILKFIIPAQNSILQCQNHKAIKYIKRLRVDFSLIHDHKFKYSFQDTIN